MLYCGYSEQKEPVFLDTAIEWLFLNCTQIWNITSHRTERNNVGVRSVYVNKHANILVNFSILESDMKYNSLY